MNILGMLKGNNNYPKIETAVYADGSKEVITVSRTLSPDWVSLDSPGYIENKLKKRIPILTSIDVTLNADTEEQTINVTVEVHGAFNSIAHLNHLVKIAAAISEIVEDRLSEPEAIKNISTDCKTFTHDEPEEKTGMPLPLD